MPRFPLLLTILLTVGGWPLPSQAQDLRHVTLNNCRQGMETVTVGHPQLQSLSQMYNAQARQANTFQTVNSDRQAFSVTALTEIEMARQRRANLFEFDPIQSRLYLMAVPMTPLWTGLGCVHEMVLVQSFLGKPNPSRTAYLTQKVQAFQTELMALNHVTRGGFNTALRQIQARRQYHTAGNIITPNARAQAALDRLFPAVLSPHERGRRDDVYMVALNFARLPNPAQRIAFLDSWFD